MNYDGVENGRDCGVVKECPPRVERDSTPRIFLYGRDLDEPCRLEAFLQEACQASVTTSSALSQLLTQAAQSDVAILAFQAIRHTEFQLLHTVRSLAAPIVVAAPDCDEQIAALHAAGAVGCLRETQPLQNLPEMILAAVLGEAIIDRRAATQVIERLTQLEYLVNDLELEKVQAADLTVRQDEILELMSSGLSNREIARELYISGSTVKNHINRIFASTGASTRQEAILGYRFRTYSERGHRRSTSKSPT